MIRFAHSLGVFLCCVLLGIAGGLAVYGQVQAGNETHRDTPPPEPQVFITTSEGRTVSWDVELALTDAQRARGLMYRERLDPTRGMLFVFSRESIQSFWMKNTAIPLDMIFIRENMTVAGVAANAKPYDLSSYNVLAPSRYVLEINAGQAAAYGVTAGDVVRFVRVPGF